MDGRTVGIPIVPLFAAQRAVTINSTFECYIVVGLNDIFGVFTIYQFVDDKFIKCILNILITNDFTFRKADILLF
jgi:hypothetical protein